MKIRTAEQFIDFISEELAWRKKELSILFSVIQRSLQETSKLQTMIRSGVTVLYAHWEGFIKIAGTKYLEYISRLDLRYRDLTIPFRALAIKNKLDVLPLTQSINIEILIETIEFLLNRQEEKYRIKWDKIIKTQSNLNSKVLKNIILALGMDYSLYMTKEKLIDNTLLYYRNNIAHGKGLFPTYSQFAEIYKETLGLIELFRNQIENAVIMEDFKMAAMNA